MKQKMHAREMEKRLGQQYAQALKENPQTAAVYKDCQEVIQASLQFMEHYNRVAMAMKRQPSARKAAGMFSA